MNLKENKLKTYEITKLKKTVFEMKKANDMYCILGEQDKLKKIIEILLINETNDYIYDILNTNLFLYTKNNYKIYI